MWGLCQKTSVLQCKDFSLWLRKFVPVRNTFPWVRDCPFTKLLSLLESLLDTLPSYTLIVDALDECTEDVQVLFRYIVNLGSRSNAQSRQGAFCHIFAISKWPLSYIVSDLKAEFQEAGDFRDGGSEFRVA